MISEPVTRREWRWLSVLVLVAFLLRVGYIFVFRTYEFPRFPGYPVQFPFGYETGSIARSIAAGEGFASPFLDASTGPTAWIAPVYPYLCAAVFKLFGIFTTTSAIVILVFNSLCAALTCIPMYLLACRTVGRRPGWYACMVWAVVPFFMRWSTTWVWEISLSALLMTCAFLFVFRLAETDSPRPWGGFGAFWGFTVLTNPALLTFIPFSALWPALRLRRHGRRWLRALFVSGFACVLVIAPWIVRNRLVMGHFVFVRDNYGFEFYLGNYHNSTGMGWMGKHPTANRIEFEKYRRLGEVAYVNRYRRQALDFVRQYPGEFARLTVLRVRAFWDGTTILYGSAFHEPWKPWMFWPLSFVTALGLVLAVANRVEAAWLYVSAVLIYPLPYYLAYSQARYRHAIEPLMLVVSAYFACEAVRALRVRLAARRLSERERVPVHA